jgi:hypothetical protein
MSPGASRWPPQIVIRYPAMAFIEYPSNRMSSDGPFVRGHRYQVLQDAPSFSGRLTAGEKLTFFGRYIGIYDGVYAYAFTNERGEERTWEVSLTEPEAAWSEFFAELPSAG